jgi:translation elongation factor EF-1beta
MKEFWKTGLALVVLAGLVSYWWFVDRKKEVKPEGERDKVTVLSVDKAKAKALEIASAGDAVKVAKDASGWKVVKPFTAPADASAVESLLTSLEKVEADEVVVEKAASLADFGLDRPSRTVSVTVEGEPAPLTLQFGAKSPDGNGQYAGQPGSSKVFLLPSWIEGSFDKKPFDLRDRDLLHVKRDDVRQLEVAGPEGGYALTRTDAGEWAFTRPLATRAGRWAIDGLLGTVENLRMESVAAEGADDKEVARFGLDKPARTVAVVTKDGQARTLEIGAGVPDAAPSPTPSPAAKGATPEPPKPTKYYAREKSSRLVAVVPATLADDLAKGMGELRAKRLLEVATYETTGFDTVASGAKKTYTRSTSKDKDGFDKSQWQRTAPDKKELDTTKVEDALFKLGAEATEFVDQPQAPAAYGLEAPALKVTVRAKGEATVEIGRKDGAFYARRSGDAAVLKLDPAKAEELLKAFAEL